MTLPNNKVKLALTEVDYKPFISIFNVTNSTVTSPQNFGIGESILVSNLFFLISSFSRLCFGPRIRTL